MADERLRIKIEADAQRAEQDLETIAELSDELSDESLTILVDAKAEAAEAEIRALTKLLQTASDPVDIKVITTGIKQANDQLEQLGRTAGRSGTAGHVDDLTRSADGSKSVLANMIGNTTQDLGALGGVAGSAGVAIGQMGEYMADAKFSGEGMSSVVKNFAGVAGPVIALGIGVFAATKAWEAYNTKTKETAKLTGQLSGDLSKITGTMDDIKESVGDGQDAWSLLNKALAENEEEFPKVATALGKLGVPTRELSKTLAAMEGDARGTWQALAEGAGIPADLAAGLAKAGAEGESFKEIFNLLQGTGLQGAAENYREVIEAIEEVNDAQQKFDLDTVARDQLNLAAAVDVTTAALVEQARAEVGIEAGDLAAWERFVELQSAAKTGAEILKSGIPGAAGVIRDIASAADEARTAHEKLREELFNTADAQMEAGRKWSDLNDDVAAFSEIAEPTRADVEGLNDSVLDYAAAQLEAAGLTHDSAAGSRLYKDALGVAAGVLGDDMNPELQTYIDKVNAVPEEAPTEVKSTLDPSGFDEADRRAEALRNNPVTIKLAADVSAFQRAAANAAAGLFGGGSGRSTQSQAARYVWRNGRYVEVG